DRWTPRHTIRGWIELTQHERDVVLGVRPFRVALERLHDPIAEPEQRGAVGEGLPREGAAQAPIAEQLARRVRALDDAVREAHEQIARAQLQRAAPDLGLDVAIAERVAARGDDARVLEH